MMENLKRKLDRKRRGLEDIIVQMTLERKRLNDAFKFKEADKFGKSLDILAIANHHLWLATIPLQ
jgi:hypothetical protein